MQTTMTLRAVRKGTVLDRTGNPKKGLPRHVLLAKMEKHLFQSVVKSATSNNKTQIRRGNESVLDSLIPVAAETEVKKPEVVTIKCGNELWQNISVKKMPQLDDYEKDGVHYKDIPYGFKVKEVGRIIIAFKTETKDGKFISFSIFENDKGKIRTEDTFDKTIKHVSSILNRIADRGEITEGNRKLLRDAFKNEKIVLASMV